MNDPGFSHQPRGHRANLADAFVDFLESKETKDAKLASKQQLAHMPRRLFFSQASMVIENVDPKS